MKINPSRNQHSNQGAAMLAVLMFVLVGGVVLTAWMQLLAARLSQTEAMGTAAQRHVSWANMRAMNEQYTYTYAMRNNVTRSASAATPPVAGWGGLDAEAYTSLKAFASTRRPATSTTLAYPYNNIVPLGTTDSAVYYEKVLAESDATQLEDVVFHNYLKSYPAPLMGDLFFFHKKPSGAGTFQMTDNLQVNGRCIIYESTADTTSVRTQSYLHRLETSTQLMKNTSNVNLLPQNFPVGLQATAGAGSGGNTAAVVDGSLKMIDNVDFTPGSIRHKMETNNTLTSNANNWLTLSTASSSATSGSTPQNIDVDVAVGTTTSEIQIKLESGSGSTYGTYPLPTVDYTGLTPTQHIGINTGTASRLNVAIVRLNNLSKHVKVVGGVEQLIIEGQANQTDYNARDTESTYPTRIIWVEQANMPDIRFVGENNRRFILATGKGTGTYLHCGFASSASALGGNNPIRWRMHWINEWRHIWIAPPTPTAVAARIIGSIRTDYSFQCTDNGSTVRIILDRETSPGGLETFLPRDGWLETYFFIP
jgi:hypothetical protein